MSKIIKSLKREEIWKANKKYLESLEYLFKDFQGPQPLIWKTMKDIHRKTILDRLSDLILEIANESQKEIFPKGLSFADQEYLKIVQTLPIFEHIEVVNGYAEFYNQIQNLYKKDKKKTKHILDIGNRRFGIDYQTP